MRTFALHLNYLEGEMEEEEEEEEELREKEEEVQRR